MRDRPNLDYEPGPEGASYSRVGPPTGPQPRPAPSGARYELAAEIGLTAGGAGPKGAAPKRKAAGARRRRAKAK